MIKLLKRCRFSGTPAAPNSDGPSLFLKKAEAKDLPEKPSGIGFVERFPVSFRFLLRAAFMNAILFVLMLPAGRIAFPQSASGSKVVLEPPSSSAYPRIEESSAIIVNGRKITPAGSFIRVQSYNWGLALSAQEQTAALVNRDAVTLISLNSGWEVRRIPSYGAKPSPKYGKGSYMGCVFSPDGKLLYYGSADEGHIKILNVKTGKVHGTIDLNGGQYRDSFIGDFVLSSDGRRLYAVDQFNYRMVSVVEKKVTLAEYGKSRLDVIIGSIMAVVVAFFIVLCCAATLHQSGITNIESGADAALALAPLAGRFAWVLFALGLANASLFAASILPLATAYTVCEGLGLEAGVDRSFSEAPEFYWLYTGIIVLSAGMILLPGTPLLKIILVSQVLNGVLLPFILVFMLLLINKKHLMGKYINGPAYNVVAWATTVVLVVLTLIMVITSFLPETAMQAAAVIKETT